MSLIWYREYIQLVFLLSCRMGNWLYGVQSYKVAGFQWFWRRHGCNGGWNLRDAHRSRKNVMFITIICIILQEHLAFLYLLHMEPNCSDESNEHLFEWWNLLLLWIFDLWKVFTMDISTLILWIRLFQGNMICVKNMIYASYSVRENSLFHKQWTCTLFILPHGILHLHVPMILKGP